MSKFKLAPVRGSLDNLKHRVLKKRARRHAGHLFMMGQHLRGSHEWARRHVRALKALGEQFE